MHRGNKIWSHTQMSESVCIYPVCTQPGARETHRGSGLYPPSSHSYGAAQDPRLMKADDEFLLLLLSFHPTASS